jgi:hypothetical protein
MSRFSNDDHYLFTRAERDWTTADEYGDESDWDSDDDGTCEQAENYTDDDESLDFEPAEDAHLESAYEARYEVYDDGNNDYPF